MRVLVLLSCCVAVWATTSVTADADAGSAVTLRASSLTESDSSGDAGFTSGSSGNASLDTTEDKNSSHASSVSGSRGSNDFDAGNSSSGSEGSNDFDAGESGASGSGSYAIDAGYSAASESGSIGNDASADQAINDDTPVPSTSVPSGASRFIAVVGPSVVVGLVTAYLL